MRAKDASTFCEQTKSPEKALCLIKRKGLAEHRCSKLGSRSVILWLETKSPNSSRSARLRDQEPKSNPGAPAQEEGSGWRPKERLGRGNQGPVMLLGLSGRALTEHKTRDEKVRAANSAKGGAPGQTWYLPSSGRHNEKKKRSRNTR